MAATIHSLQPAHYDGVVSGRGPGSKSGNGVFGTCEVLAAAVTDPESYIYIFDDFLDFDSTATTGNWVVTQATAGTAARIDGAGGILQLDCNSTTADQGIQAQRISETFKIEAGKDIWFQTRLYVTDTVDKVQLFAGLSVLDTTIFASGEISASDYLGFLLDATKQAGADAGKVDLEIKKTGQTAELVSNVKLLVDATYVLLGFHLYWGTDGTTCYMQAYVDGVPTGDPETVTNYPATEMTVSFACLSEGTNDPIALVDYVKVIAER